MFYNNVGLLFYDTLHVFKGAFFTIIEWLLNLDPLVSFSDFLFDE